jgi:hypothetical protein
MFMATIVCPKTGNRIPTGVVFGDRKTFENQSNVFKDNTTQCPECGIGHAWAKEGVTLQEMPPRR